MAEQKIDIAIIDDDADDRAIFMQAAKNLDLGIRTLEFENGPQLVEFLQKSDNPLPQILFLDLNNPAMGGLECLHIIKQMKKCSGILIAIYSTSSMRKDVDGTFVLGADLYIKKPTELKEIEKYITKALKINSNPLEMELSRKDYFLKI